MAQRIMKEQEFESDVFDRGTWNKVFQLLWEHKKSVIPLIFFNTILAVTDVIMPLLNRYALNTYVDDQTGADTLPVFILVYVGMILAQCLLCLLYTSEHGQRTVSADFTYAWLREQLKQLYDGEIAWQ